MALHIFNITYVSVFFDFKYKNILELTKIQSTSLLTSVIIIILISARQKVILSWIYISIKYMFWYMLDSKREAYYELRKYPVHKVRILRSRKAMLYTIWIWWRTYSMLRLFTPYRFGLMLKAAYTWTAPSAIRKISLIVGDAVHFPCYFCVSELFHFLARIFLFCIRNPLSRYPNKIFTLLNTNKLRSELVQQWIVDCMWVTNDKTLTQLHDTLMA